MILLLQYLHFFVTSREWHFLLGLITKICPNSTPCSDLSFTCQKICINIFDKFDFVASSISRRRPWFFLTWFSTDCSWSFDFPLIDSHDVCYILRIKLLSNRMVILRSHLTTRRSPNFTSQLAQSVSYPLVPQMHRDSFFYDLVVVGLYIDI